MWIVDPQAAWAGSCCCLSNCSVILASGCVGLKTQRQSLELVAQQFVLIATSSCRRSRFPQVPVWINDHTRFWGFPLPVLSATSYVDIALEQSTRGFNRGLPAKNCLYWRKGRRRSLLAGNLRFSTRLLLQTFSVDQMVEYGYFLHPVFLYFVPHHFYPPPEPSTSHPITKLFVCSY